MHIDNERAENWLKILLDGVENENSLAELAVTRAMAGGVLYKALKDLLDCYDPEEGVIDVRPDAGCLECTCGTTPVNFQKGPCAYHRALAAIKRAEV